MRVTMGLLGILAFLALTSAQDNHTKQKRHPGPKMVPVPVPIPVPVHHHHHHPVVMPAGSNNYQEWTGSSGQIFPEAQMIQETQDNGFFDPRGLRDFQEIHHPYPRYAFQSGYDGGRPRTKNYYSANAGHSSGERSGDHHHYAPGSEPRGHRRRIRPSRTEMESQVPGPMKPSESFQENSEW